MKNHGYTVPEFMRISNIVGEQFYRRSTLKVAPELIGLYLVRRDPEQPDEVLFAGRIVETEAYRQDDPASHSFRGPTRRARVMFEAGGLAYVYFIYGMYDCFNVVTEAAGSGGAVLIRAVEPLVGVEQMNKNRTAAGTKAWPAHRIANGPGKLTRAFGITTAAHNGASLVSGEIVITRSLDRPDDSAAADTDPRAVPVLADHRIGITRGTEKRWRFLLSGSRYLSRPPSEGARRWQEGPDGT